VYQGCALVHVLKMQGEYVLHLPTTVPAASIVK
jgi:hypothetical protein